MSDVRVERLEINVGVLGFRTARRAKAPGNTPHVFSSLVPRPIPRFSVLRFPLTIIHGCRRAAKNAEGLHHVSDVRWMQGWT